MTRLGSSEPSVGIFWRFRGRLIIDASPLSQAEKYGDCLTHSRSHIDHWSDLQCSGKVPNNVEYEEAPRGRIVYLVDTRHGHWVMYADRCILRRPAVIREIIRKMNLSEEQVQIDTDSHYRCFHCLGYLGVESTE